MRDWIGEKGLYCARIEVEKQELEVSQHKKRIFFFVISDGFFFFFFPFAES